jgi:membrane protease YdiL (CAAX protease family)
MTTHPKVNVMIILYICAQTKQLWKIKSNLTIILSSFLFTSLHFLFLFVFTLNFSKQGCNGEEEKETCFALRIMNVFVHACEAY